MASAGLRAVAWGWRVVVAAASVAWAALIWRLSATPGGTEPSSYLVSLRNNAGHAVLFGVQASLIYFIAGRRARGSRWVTFVIVLCLLLAVMDEYHQHFVPNRSASAGDVATDTLGAGAAISLLRAIEGGGRNAFLAFLACALGAAVSAWLETGV